MAVGGELSRAELIAKGDEICERAHDAFREQQAEPPRTGREAAELTENLLGIAEDELDEIDDLNEPDELEDQLAGYLDARREGIDLIREGRDAAEDSDSSAYERAQGRLARTQHDPRYDLARELGFEVCSEPLVGASSTED